MLLIVFEAKLQGQKAPTPIKGLKTSRTQLLAKCNFPGKKNGKERPGAANTGLFAFN